MRKTVFWRAIDGLSRCRLPSFTTANATDGTAGNGNAPYIFPQYDSRLNIRRQAVSSPTDDSLNKVKYHEAVMKNLFFIFNLTKYYLLLQRKTNIQKQMLS